MCDKAVDYYPHALKFVPDCYKIQNMCDKAVNTYPSTIQFVPECYKIQEMYDKAVNRYFLYLRLYGSTDFEIGRCSPNGFFIWLR